MVRWDGRLSRIRALGLVGSWRNLLLALVIVKNSFYNSLNILQAGPDNRRLCSKVFVRATDFVRVPNRHSIVFLG